RSTKEDARRMEVTKKQIKQKSELEKKTLRIVECLLEDDVTEEFLIESAQFITPAHYKDATEERSIIKVCGYPLCSNRLDNVPNQKYKISTKSNRIYDLTVRKCFCSNFCYKASKHFELQISSTPLWMRGYGSPSEIILMKKGDVTAQDQPAVAPALPLVDSRAQHTIQKRITVEKLTSCLKNIIGPLQLTLSDITTDLNELVRTFKFTNKNIIHKTPEWTIIAVVLLHVELSCLEKSKSVELEPLH
uniref:RNA polymerase II subunit B1 CTD phosphatase RPAP2 homolog n=1 Tax=Takifugu rubripes TaxID=31033 RepID=A0A674N8I0_TAKRU